MWPDLANFRHFCSQLLTLWPLRMFWFSICKIFEQICANFKRFWANFNCCKWPNIEQKNIAIWSHWSENKFCNRIDEQVYWYESLIMLIAYMGYILLMYFNTSLERWSISVQKSVMKKIYPSSGESGAATPRVPPANESTPLHNADKGTQVSLATATVGTMTTK